jgi:hypothetical protein
LAANTQFVPSAHACWNALTDGPVAHQQREDMYRHVYRENLLYAEIARDLGVQNRESQPILALLLTNLPFGAV